MLKNWAKQNLYQACKDHQNSTTEGAGIEIVEYTSYEIKAGKLKSETDFVNTTNPKKLVLIKSDKNLGYSGGNNLGIIYAIEMGYDAVLIVNPDVIIPDKNFLNILSKTLFSDEKIVLVGPRVLTPDGKQQSPLREPSYFEELLYPLKKTEFIINSENLLEPITVDKVHGCCFLARTRFLKEAGLLDENVFLFSEEAIILFKAKKYGGLVVFEPRTFVIHKHINTMAKPNFLKIAIQSRLYVLKKYKNIGGLKYLFISLKYYANFAFYLIKYSIKRAIPR
jgi:GT2 family glycosyltransferase